MSKTSTGVVVTRIAVAVILLSLIFTCVYFFIIKARDDAQNADNQIFATLNNTLGSANVVEINRNLGALESGGYYTYAQSQGGLGYKEAYLNYHVAREMLDAYSFRLISSRGNTGAIQNAINDVNNQAVILLRSQQVYNTTKESYGDNPTSEQRQALLTNFNVIVKDLSDYSSVMKNLAHEVFSYTSDSYYSGVNKFESAQYLLGYCMDIQAGLLDEAVKTDELNVSNILYTDTLKMVKNFTLVKQNNFVEQTTDADIISTIDYFLDEENGKFDDFLKSKDKKDFVSKITNATQKTKTETVLAALGL